jgi:hypothetical protein
MCTDEVNNYMNQIQKDQIILCGLETQVCILQTAYDLINQGKEVHLICDAVSSQRLTSINNNIILYKLTYYYLYRPYDRTVAIQRMQDMGVVLTTSESAVFQLLKTSTNPHFKSIIKLIKETNLETNDFRNDRML